MPARYSAGMIDRRHFVALAAIPLTGLGARTSQATGMSRVTAYAFTFKGLDGDDILLLSYAGHPLLVVNTASQCGYTPQYAGLQKLWTRYRDRGLIVLGVPSNDFGGQEPGGKSEIHDDTTSRVTRPLSPRPSTTITAQPMAMASRAERAVANTKSYSGKRAGRLSISFPIVAPTASTSMARRKQAARTLSR